MKSIDIEMKSEVVINTDHSILALYGKLNDNSKIQLPINREFIIDTKDLIWNGKIILLSAGKYVAILFDPNNKFEISPSKFKFVNTFNDQINILPIKEQNEHASRT